MENEGNTQRVLGQRTIGGERTTHVCRTMEFYSFIHGMVDILYTHTLISKKKGNTFK